jgi:hypothetical protein
MPIREFFHLIHVVDDINEANDRIGALFGTQRFRENWSDHERRWASFTMVSDMMLELIQPRHEPDDCQFALTKFHERFGQHLHSLSWYIDMEDMPALFAALRADGVRIAKPGGGLFPEGTVDPGTAMFTHPKDTGGHLEFVASQVRSSDFDPRTVAGWTPPTPDVSPLTVVGVSHFTTSALNRDKLKGFYERVLGATTLYEGEGSVFVQVGTQSIVELATPTVPGSLLDRDVAANGELPHSVTFRVADLDAAEGHATKIGVRAINRTDTTLLLDPEDMFGAVLVFAEKPPFGR